MGACSFGSGLLRRSPALRQARQRPKELGPYTHCFVQFLQCFLRRSLCQRQSRQLKSGLVALWVQAEFLMQSALGSIPVFLSHPKAYATRIPGVEGNLAIASLYALSARERHSS